jgi:hypothetical protein
VTSRDPAIGIDRLALRHPAERSHLAPVGAPIEETLIEMDRHQLTCHFALHCVTRITIDPAKLVGPSRGSQLSGGIGGKECKT